MSINTQIRNELDKSIQHSIDLYNSYVHRGICLYGVVRGPLVWKGWNYAVSNVAISPFS